MTDQSLATYPMNYKFEIEFEQDRVLIAFKSDQQKVISSEVKKALIFSIEEGEA